MLSYIDTKMLIENVLRSNPKQVRVELYRRLKLSGSSEGEFYASIVEHAPSMKLNPEEWFDLLCKLPNRVLRSQLSIEKMLSEKQLGNLPPTTG